MIARHRRRVVPVAGLAIWVVAAIACGGTPTQPPPPPPSGPILTVILKDDCEGIVSSVEVSVDGARIGVTTPGATGLKTEVGVGNHEISAIAPEGLAWGPFDRFVPSRGLIQRLTCR